MTSGSTQPAGAPTALQVTLAAKTARASLAQLVLLLNGVLVLPTSNTPKRRGKRDARRRQAAPLLAQVLTDDPTLTARTTPDAINACMNAGQALDLLTADLKAATNVAGYNAALQYGDGWTAADYVYLAAEADAKHDHTMSETLAPIQAILAVGSRTDTAPKTTVAAQTNATQLLKRATKAQAETNARVRSQARQAEAHTDVVASKTPVAAVVPPPPLVVPPPSPGNGSGH